MPELPEVETIRIQLNQVLKGLKINDVEILKPKSFQGDKKKIIGKTIKEIQRRAKIILIELEGGLALAIHLKLTGQLIYRRPEEKVLTEAQKNGPFTVGELPNKYTRVIISFNNGSKLFFNDLRIFGWIKVIKDWQNLPEIKRIGPEANDEKAFTLPYFQQILASSKKPVKLVIMDQEKLAGVGNIYANEALFVAGVKPTRPANRLIKKEIERLRNSIISILRQAVAHQGTSDKDEAYRQISGEKGHYQNFLKVYGRNGEKCLKCGTLIKRIKLGGRGTFYCPQCQK
jgi:formamidopyrimidine-DNA glycosylase